LNQKQITAATYYNERLKIDAGAFEGHLNLYNKLNGDLNTKLKQGSGWSPWNRIAIIAEVIFILINVLGQAYLIIDVYRKNKAEDSLSDNSLN